MRRTYFWFTVAALLLAACGDDDSTGPNVPNLLGTYEGTWTTTVEGSGLETSVFVCPGTVTVTDQSTGVFEGTFSQTGTEDCEAGDGFVTGTYTADGAITVLLGAPGGGGPAFEESTGCTIVTADDRYTGAYADGTLSFDPSLTARCPESGDVDVVWTFAFDGS